MFKSMGSTGYWGLHIDILLLLWGRMGLRGSRGAHAEERLAEFLQEVQQVAQEYTISSISIGLDCPIVDIQSAKTTKYGEFWLETVQARRSLSTIDTGE